MTNVKTYMKMYLNIILRRLGYMPVPQFPQAGVGSGLIFYRVLGPRKLRVLISSRSSNVGPGSGISCGGWFELKAMLDMPDGAMVTDAESATREGWEEIPGLLNVLPEAVLLANAQMVFGAAVYKPYDRYGNSFHKVAYMAMAVTAAEEDALCRLPKSSETSAPLRAVDLTWDGDSPTAEDLRGMPGDFHHTHEREAFAALARLAEVGRLWER